MASGATRCLGRSETGMPYGLYISAEGAQAQAKRLEVIANNLANVDTVGFKRQLAVLNLLRTCNKCAILRPVTYEKLYFNPARYSVLAPLRQIPRVV